MIQIVDETLLESRIIVGNFCCCNCGEGTRGGVCKLSTYIGVVMMLFWFRCEEFFY